MLVAHVSDLHVKSIYYSDELAENLLDFLTETNPDILVITGDLTDEGYLHEYVEAHRFIRRLRAKNKVIVPGNHDSRNMGYKLFEEFFGTRQPIFEKDWLKIVGVDSSEPDVDDGNIGMDVYGLIKKEFDEFDGIKVFALHHHLIPIPGTGRERNIPADSGDVLELLMELGVNLVLSGHKHVPWIWKLNEMLIVNAGTATTLRIKGRIPSSFNLIEIKDDGTISIELVRTKDLKVEEKYRDSLESGKILLKLH
ncbi:metallophosphoesterase [Candidatus Bathyarchaeota archaeon]|nr:MAG: metallophosphoesterase [Candidatus Bathyarchaeota archaeon]